jgi:hypothetical protein
VSHRALTVENSASRWVLMVETRASHALMLENRANQWALTVEKEASHSALKVENGAWWSQCASGCWLSNSANEVITDSYNSF